MECDHVRKRCENAPQKGAEQPQKIKETDIINTNSVLKTPEEEASMVDTLAVMGVEPILTNIPPRVDAESEADRQNIAQQVAI